MLKNMFAVLSAISLILYAVVDFLKNVFEAAFRVRLITEKVNYSSSDWMVGTENCQHILLTLAIICFAIFIVSIVVDLFHNRKSK